MTRFAFVAILVSIFTAACAGNVRPKAYPERKLTYDNKKAFHIGATDILTVNLDADNPTLAMDFTVQSDGDISLPKIGQIRVADLTTRDAQLAVQKAAQNVGLTGDVWLAVKESNSCWAYVIGTGLVEQSLIQMRRPMTLLQAIGSTKGFNEWVKLGGVFVARHEGGEYLTNHRFNFKGFQKGKRTNDVPLECGDTIVVP